MTGLRAVKSLADTFPYFGATAVFASMGGLIAGVGAVAGWLIFVVVGVVLVGLAGAIGTRGDFTRADIRARMERARKELDDGP